MSDLATVRDCDRALDRIGREQHDAIRNGANWKLGYLKRKKVQVIQAKLELQHGDLFRVLGQERSW